MVPYSYAFVVSINKIAGDYTITNSLWRNITLGVTSDSTGRLNISHLKGDFYNVGIEVHHAYDVDRFDDFHIWGFGGSPYDVIAYTNSHLIGIRLYRTDSPFIDRIFIINAFKGLDLETEGDGTDFGGNTIPGGGPTKVLGGSFECDGTRYCIYNNYQASTLQIANLNEQGADNTKSPFTTWTDSTAIYNNLFGYQMIGSIHVQAIGGPVVYDADANECASTSIGSLLLDGNDPPVNMSGYVAGGVSCDSTGANHHTVNLAISPNRTMASPPSTFMPSGSAVILSWPTSQSYQ